MPERGRTAERLVRLRAWADRVRCDPFEDDRDHGDDEAEAEQAPVRRNPQTPEPFTHGHSYGFFGLRTGVVVVLVCPGAVLFPCTVDRADVFLTCPGAVLFPCGVLTLAVFPAGEVCVAVVAVLAANTSAGTAGRRSDAEGWRGVGSLVSTGGPWEGRRTWANGIPATGIKPSPPSTIASNQARNTTNTARPPRRSHRARRPVGSSRTANPPASPVVPTIPISTVPFVPLLTPESQAPLHGSRVFRLVPPERRTQR